VDITGVEVIGDHRLRLTFEDETVGDVDFSEREWSGVLEPLGDVAYFSRVTVDPEAGTISWPNGVEMAPEPLYAEARAKLDDASTSRLSTRDLLGRDHASADGAVPGAVLDRKTLFAGRFESCRAHRSIRG
jgi:hypothetical protein